MQISLAIFIPNIITEAGMVSQKIFNKKFIIQRIKRKVRQTQGRIKQEKRRLVRYPLMKLISVNLHTKYDYSTSFHGLTEIFDEKCVYSEYEKKENWTCTGKNKR